MLKSATGFIISEKIRHKNRINKGGGTSHRTVYAKLHRTINQQQGRGVFTSYGSVLALHHSRSICLTFLTLGTPAEGRFWAEATDGLPWLWRRNVDVKIHGVSTEDALHKNKLLTRALCYIHTASIYTHKKDTILRDA